MVTVCSRSSSARPFSAGGLPISNVPLGMTTNSPDVSECLEEPLVMIRVCSAHLERTPSKQVLAQNFPHRVLGDLVPKIDDPGAFEIGDLEPAICKNIVFGTGRRRDDHGLDLLASRSIRNSDHRRVRNRWVRAQQRFQFRGIYLVPG